MTEPNPPSGCLAPFPGLQQFVRRLLGDSPSSAATPAELPKVMINKYFVSSAECSLLHGLRRVVGDRAHILAQVSLQQLFYFPSPRAGSDRKAEGKSARSIWQNKVRAKSIDFLLCDPRTMKPLVAIEYDDRSHEQERRKTRDAEVERLFAAAGLPLLRIPCGPPGRGVDVQLLQQLLAPHLPAGAAQ